MIPRTLALAALLAAGIACAADAQGTAPAATSPAPPSASAHQARRAPTAAQAAQQERMRACNTQAGAQNLRGDGRRAFMRNCLAGRGAADAAAATPPAATPTRN